MNLKIVTPSLIKYKKKNQFRLMEKIYDLKWEYTSKTTKIVFKSPLMLKYFEGN